MNGRRDNAPVFSFARQACPVPEYKAVAFPPDDKIIFAWRKDAINDNDVVMKDAKVLPRVTLNTHKVGANGVLDEIFIKINTVDIGVGSRVWETGVYSDAFGGSVLAHKFPLKRWLEAN